MTKKERALMLQWLALIEDILGPSDHDKEWSCMKGHCKRCDAMTKARAKLKELKEGGK